MHLLFQVLCFIICSGIISYLNKTAESDIVFSKVSFLAIFAGNKIRENSTSIFHVKEEFEHSKDTRECSRPKQAWPTRPDPNRHGPRGQIPWPCGACSFGPRAPPRLQLSCTPSYIPKTG
jgi:hypothetical protein